ncbi:AI-2E family transporter [Piscinibacter sp. XHJ-5]|uniref:AI-2E family transporter n=1 Tax=Piscinibacter sp. XHJ-5 TaxID=3037797 RepID=UPI002452FA7D|nr:AI-2E family transporter [Piscinibacter sp. XHJ-5]
MTAISKPPSTPATGPRLPASSWALRALVGVAVVFLLQAAKPLLLPVLLAVALTFMLSAPVRGLRRLGMPEAAGAALVVAAALTVCVAVGAMLAQPAADWWERAPGTVRTLIDSAQRVRTAIWDTASPPAGRKSKASPAAAAAPAAQPDPIADKIASEGLSFTRVVLGQMLWFAVQAAATVILLYFLLASEHWLVSRTVEAVPRRRTRALVLGGIRQAQREIGLFLGTMSLINLGLGTLTALALAAIGLPNPVLWGVVTAIMNFVPYLGPAVVAGALLVAGSMSVGVDLGMLAPPAVFLVLHAIESNLATPWVMGRRLRLAPLSVFLSVMVWGWLWGIAGALIAVPLLLGLRIVCKRSKRLKLVCVYLEGDATPPPSLRALLRKRRPQSSA